MSATNLKVYEWVFMSVNSWFTIWMGHWEPQFSLQNKINRKMLYQKALKATLNSSNSVLAALSLTSYLQS